MVISLNNTNIDEYVEQFKMVRVYKQQYNNLYHFQSTKCYIVVVLDHFNVCDKYFFSVYIIKYNLTL